MAKKITNIVFTKNRPLQLHGYLQGLYRSLPSELIQTYIIYKVEFFQQEYEEVFCEFPESIVIKETDFNSDFLNVISRADTKYILFGVDDVVYFDSVDFVLIDKIFKEKNDIFGFSLRFGQNIFSGTDEVEKIKMSDQIFYYLDWTKGQTPNTRYPFELCATIYKTELVKKILKGCEKNSTICKNLLDRNPIFVKVLSKIIKRHKLLKKFGCFYNPNTLESWNCRWCQSNAERLPTMIYFQKLCAAAMQVNMVNTSTNNKIDNCDEYTVETLAEKYKQGYRLDINSVIKTRPVSTHCGQENFILTKK